MIVPSLVATVIKSTVNIEGGVFNHPSDIGGLTKYGVASRYNPEVKDKIQDGSFSVDDAINLYYEKYWCGSKAAEAYNLGYRGIAYLIFDNYVAGHKFVTKYMQALIFLMTNRVGVIDGKFGKESIASLQKLGLNEQLLIIELIEQMAEPLAQLTASQTMKSQKKMGLPVYDFTKGFTNRIIKKAKAAKEAIYGREYNPY